MDKDEAMDLISQNLSFESWVEGQTLTAMIDGDGMTRLVKLRFAGMSSKPSVYDLRGEPE